MLPPSCKPQKRERVMARSMSQRDWRNGHSWRDVSRGLGALRAEVKQCREAVVKHDRTALRSHLLLVGFVLGEVILVALEVTRPD